MSLARTALACAFTCLLASTHSSAQTTVSIKGLVQDQTRAAVPNAKIVLKRSDETLLAQGRSNEDGEFRLEAVIAPDTLLVVAAPGFAVFERALRSIRSASSDLKVVLEPAPLSERVNVTATRTETRLGDTAASIATLTSADLLVTSAITLDDTLRQVPGFSLFRRSGSRTANPTSQGVSLRGVGASGASRAVVLEDGIPLNDPFGGWVYWSRVPRASVESMEVLRGGASHLYGSGAVGGVVNILTRGSENTVLDLEASYGNQGTADASLFAGAHKQRWRASLTAQYFLTDGYVIVDRRGRGNIDVPANSRNAVLNFKVERALQDVGAVFAAASFFGESRSNGTPLQTNRTHLRRFSLGGDLGIKEIGNFTFRAYGGTQLFDQNFSAVSPDRLTEALTRVQRVPAQSIGFSAQWSRTIWNRHSVVAGTEAHEVRGASNEIAHVNGRPTSLIGAGGRERAVGLFLQDIVQLTSELFITAGMRFDRWRNFEGVSNTRPLAPTAVTTSIVFPDREETAFSPHLSLLYKPAENVGLYASASRAFRSPTLNELYRSFRVGDVLTLANANLLAERLTSAEVGSSYSFFKQRLNLRASYFWSEITRPVANVTLSVQPALITRQRQNLGRTRSRGLEIEWDLRLANRWTVSGGYLFADSTVLSFPGNTMLEGFMSPQVPRHQLTFQFRYANPRLIDFGVQARGSSAQFDDDQNRLSLERYFTVDALVSRSLSRVIDAFMAVENIFDRRYTIGLTPVRTVGPPVLMRAGFRLRLGSK